MDFEKIRYLIAGGVNTLAGYLIGVGAYKFLFDIIGIWGVGLVANLLAITFSFLTYKLLVFKTSGKWLVEYLKCYVVYGTMALVGMLLLWAFVEKMQVSIWLAQAMVMMCTFFLSYLGHKKFTFAVRGL